MRQQVIAAIAFALLAMGLLFAALSGDTPDDVAAEPEPTAAPTSAPEPSATPTLPPPPPRLGSPWGEAFGMLQFRGNPAHTFYGHGPVPTEPTTAWRYPAQPMCTTEKVGTEEVVVTDPDTGEPVTDPETGQPVTEERDITKRWCGTGWTGQPIVWDRPDGVTEVIFGGYDGAVHFLDGSDGTPTRPKFQTGFMIKGTVTLDPDGFPILYTGSRDGFLRAIALDRDVPTELWRLGRHPQGVWNDDWDGNVSIVDGILHVGGEDSWYRAVELHRSTGPDGLVVMDPQVLVEVAGFDDELFRQVGDRNVSIENSVVVDVERERVYFGNSGGRVLGLDVSDIRSGTAPIVLDVWLGDDIDGSLVLDHDGTLVVPIEFERRTPRSLEVGQLVKLDPTRPDDPIVWSVAVPDDPRPGVAHDDGGIWATPALWDGVIYTTTHPGDLLVVDAATGEVIQRERIGYHEWSSPVVVDETLVVARCDGGALLAWDVTDPRVLRPMWESKLPSGACIESTPTVHNGSIYVGSRDGFFYGWR